MDCVSLEAASQDKKLNMAQRFLNPTPRLSSSHIFYCYHSVLGMLPLQLKKKIKSQSLEAALGFVPYVLGLEFWVCLGAGSIHEVTVPNLRRVPGNNHAGGEWAWAFSWWALAFIPKFRADKDVSELQSGPHARGCPSSLEEGIGWERLAAGVLLCHMRFTEEHLAWASAWGGYRRWFSNLKCSRISWGLVETQTVPAPGLLFQEDWGEPENVHF